MPWEAAIEAGAKDVNSHPDESICVVEVCGMIDSGMGCGD